MTIYGLYTKGLVDGADLIKVVFDDNEEVVWIGQLSDCPLMFANKIIESISSLYAEKPNGSITSALLITIFKNSFAKGE